MSPEQFACSVLDKECSNQRSRDMARLSELLLSLVETLNVNQRDFGCSNFITSYSFIVANQDDSTVLHCEGVLDD